MRERRGDLIGLAALEVGKTFLEIDPEVSEAIDFTEFYPHSLKVLREQNKNTQFSPKGIGVTIAPWEFPYRYFSWNHSSTISSGQCRNLQAFFAFNFNRLYAL